MRAIYMNKFEKSCFITPTYISLLFSLPTPTCTYNYYTQALVTAVAYQATYFTFYTNSSTSKLHPYGFTALCRVKLEVDNEQESALLIYSCNYCLHLITSIYKSLSRIVLYLIHLLLLSLYTNANIIILMYIICN